MNTMIEIVTIWLKILGIIILWEAWKYVGWHLINEWIEYKVKQHESSNNKK